MDIHYLITRNKKMESGYGGDSSLLVYYVVSNGKQLTVASSRATRYWCSIT
jgi:hypothetical protein